MHLHVLDESEFLAPLIRSKFLSFTNCIVTNTIPAPKDHYLLCSQIRTNLFVDGPYYSEIEDKSRIRAKERHFRTITF